jgi:hypothetical protein
VLSCVLVGLDLFHDNVSYSIMVGWLYALVDFISIFLGFFCMRVLDCLGLFEAVLVVVQGCISGSHMLY